MALIFFLTIVDDYSRGTWVYLMKHKDQTAAMLMNFYNMVETQFNASIKRIRSDNDTEFINSTLQKFFHQKGILHESSCVATPQQNGRVERKHRHILNVARALRFQANLPIRFWGECILAATHIINRTLTAANQGVTPYEMLFERPPTYNHLRVFGCLCYVGTNSKQRDKFDSRADRCIFIGYPQGQKGWKVYNLKTHQFYVSRDVIFYEHELPYMASEKNDALELPRSIFHNVAVSQDESNTNCEENQDESQEVQNEGEIQVT